MTVWEKTEEGYGMRRKYAIKERFSYKKDIRGRVLPFVRLSLFVVAFTFCSYSHLFFIRAIRFRIRFHISLLFSGNCFLLLLFVPIKVSFFQTIGNPDPLCITQ